MTRMSPDRAKAITGHVLERAGLLDTSVARVFDWALVLQKGGFPSAPNPERPTVRGGEMSDPTFQAAISSDQVDRSIRDLIDTLETLMRATDAAWSAMQALTPPNQEIVDRLRKLATDADTRGGAKRYCKVCDKPAPQLRSGRCDPCRKSFERANPGSPEEIDAWTRRRRTQIVALETGEPDPQPVGGAADGRG